MSRFDAGLNRLSSPSEEREFVVSGLELWQWRETARQQAIAADIPLAEVDWLLQELAGLDRLTLRLESFKAQRTIPMQRPFVELITLWQQRVLQRVPVQYLVGVVPWRQFRLTVSPAVLIPRPETEYLIDLAVQANLKTPHHWADLGTGSGAIALGLATAFPDATIHAVDFSAAALAIAQENAQALHLSDRMRFYQGNWLEPLGEFQGSLDGIVANPPYIPSGMVPDLQPEVVRHEPHLALDGGEDGLDCLRHLVTTAPVYLRSGGVWLVEMMSGQAIAVAELLRQQGSYRDIQIYPDLAGIERFAIAYRL